MFVHLLVPKEARRRHWILWNWIITDNCNPLCVLGTEPGSFSRGTIEISLPPISNPPTRNVLLYSLVFECFQVFTFNAEENYLSPETPQMSLGSGCSIVSYSHVPGL